MSMHANAIIKAKLMIKQVSLSIALLLAVGPALVSADNGGRNPYGEVSGPEESVGLLGGLALGASVGGPPGAIAGATIGALLGDGWSAKKTRQ